MERGQLGLDDRPSIVFVFDGLIAKLKSRRLLSLYCRAHQWEAALSLWEFDYRVCDYTAMMISRYGTPVEVLTWQPYGFGDILYDRLWEMDVQVRSVRCSEYIYETSHIATDPSASLVYDANPEHRFGYGFKCRDFDPARI
jgi:hypothetical protein